MVSFEDVQLLLDNVFRFLRILCVDQELATFFLKVLCLFTKHDTPLEAILLFSEALVDMLADFLLVILVEKIPRVYNWLLAVLRS